MITPALPSNFASAVAPFSPVGKLAVGQDGNQTRNTSFTPVQELPESAAALNRSTTSERAVQADEQAAARLGELAASPNRNQVDQQAEAQEEEQQAQQAEERQQQALDQAVIDQLAVRDREVRAHEQAHAAVGGQLAGSPSYEYERGPDGVSYAVAGEVPISSGAVPGDPEATLANARIVQQAALAPADPSPQDRRVAADAAQLQQQALQEIAAQAQEARAQVDAELAAEREAKAEERERQEQQQLERDQQRQADLQAVRNDDRADQQDAFVRNNIDLNQRLIDIGVSPTPAPVGNLLNQIA
tara:strand:- start:353 stop:1258 length:906 start_codon:yes stop_codon:yes gene_type:complete